LVITAVRVERTLACAAAAILGTHLNIHEICFDTMI
jgi:hypothetical protein